MPAAATAPGVKGPKHLSPSGESTWRECPAKWKAKYVDKIPDPSGPEAAIGTAAHTVLEQLGDLTPANRTIPVAARIAKPVLYEAFPASGETPARRAAWGHVVRALEMPIVAQGETIRTEMKLSVNLGALPFFGILDRADRTNSDGVLILDYKTGKMPDLRYMDDKLRQLLIYVAAYEKLYDEIVKAVALVWTATSTPVVRRVQRDAVENVVVEFQDAWSEIQEALKTGRYEPQPGPLCSWCPAAATCAPGALAIQKRAKDKRKSLGPHAPAALAALENLAEVPLTLNL